VNIKNQQTQAPPSRLRAQAPPSPNPAELHFQEIRSEEEQLPVFVNHSYPAEGSDPHLQAGRNGQSRDIKDQIINLMNARQAAPVRQSLGRDSELPNDSHYYYQPPQDYSGWSQIDNKVVNGDDYDFAASRPFDHQEPDCKNYDISRFGEPASFMNKPIFPGDSQIYADPVDNLENGWTVAPPPNFSMAQNQRQHPEALNGQPGPSLRTAYNQNGYQPSSFSPVRHQQ